MGFTKKDRDSIEKFAEDKGYKWNSTDTKMINGNKSFGFSQTGQSGTLNGNFFNSSGTIKKSGKW